MKVIFLGNGNLGKYLQNQLRKNFYCYVFPLRNIEVNLLNEFIDFQKESFVVVDLMDPNSLDKVKDLSLINKGMKIRNLFKTKQNISHYIYLSTANLYTPSTSNIFEFSSFLGKSNSKYIEPVSYTHLTLPTT